MRVYDLPWTTLGSKRPYSLLNDFYLRKFTSKEQKPNKDSELSEFIYINEWSLAVPLDHDISICSASSPSNHSSQPGPDAWLLQDYLNSYLTVSGWVIIFGLDRQVEDAGEHVLMCSWKMIASSHNMRWKHTKNTHQVPQIIYKSVSFPVVLHGLWESVAEEKWLNLSGFWRATVQKPAQSDRAAVNTLYIRLYVRFTVVTSTGDERRHHAAQYKNKY